MSLTTAFQISTQGMTAQRERLEASIANLANANTTRTPTGGPYQRRDVVFETVAVPNAEGTRSATGTLPGVQASIFINPHQTGEKNYQPGHPDADADGYVTRPDVNPLEEIVNLMSATRAFEANATAFNTAKEMVRTSLKLGEIA